MPDTFPTNPLPSNVYGAIVERVEAKHRFALLTVLMDAGSTPRKAGTRAFVDADGTMWGTVGGGLLESQARSMALDAIGTGKPVVFDFRFSGASARGDDPVCGGVMRLLIDPAPSAHLSAYAAAAHAQQSRRRGVLTTSVHDENIVGVHWVSDDPGTDQSVRYVAPQGGVELLVEPVSPASLLLIAGGGHVGQALAMLAAPVGFEVVVVEDREAFAEPSRYPDGVTVRRGRFAELVREWPLNRDTFVAIVGRGHKVDADALAAVIGGDAGYVGMMGSRRKVALVRQEFLASGLATAEQFGRVHAPIGLDIGAETVPEIAASIVAEMIAVRRGKRFILPVRGS